MLGFLSWPIGKLLTAYIKMTNLLESVNSCLLFRGGFGNDFVHLRRGQLFT